MIDEKKIQEAAEVYTDKHWLSDDCCTACADGFTGGVQWVLQELVKGLWHDASEEPQRGEQCLVDMEFLYEDAPEDNYRTFITSTYGTWGWTEDSMPSEATNFKLHRWCYIKDLLKGDKHE